MMFSRVLNKMSIQKNVHTWYILDKYHGWMNEWMYTTAIEGKVAKSSSFKCDSKFKRIYSVGLCLLQWEAIVHFHEKISF